MSLTYHKHSKGCFWTQQGQGKPRLCNIPPNWIKRYIILSSFKLILWRFFHFLTNIKFKLHQNLPFFGLKNWKIYSSPYLTKSNLINFIVLLWKTTIFIKIVVLLKITKDDPLLTIVNEDPNDGWWLMMVDEDPLLRMVNNDTLLTIVNENTLLMIINDVPLLMI